MSELTPIQAYPGGWFAKRDDFACYLGPDRPSGSKVRQYLAMAAKAPPGTPAVVGCSANGSMQVYVADAALRLGVKGYVLVPQRKKKTALTEWCEKMGVEVKFLHCGWPSFVKKQARQFAKSIGGCIRWDRDLAVADVRAQVKRIPPEVTRVVVATGSGLTALGIMLGLHDEGRSEVSLLCVDTCGISDASALKAMFVDRAPAFAAPPAVIFQESGFKYGQPEKAELPTGQPLDCNYAAKCLKFIRSGDLLWVQGLRPLALNQ